MDVEEIQAQACKFSRVGNGSSNNKLVVQKGGGGGGGVVQQYPVDDDEDGGGGGGEIRGRVGIVASTESGTLARLRGWHHNSRIFRVSRASGGKDRHSKVLTSKGLRDRRVRLSVSTAIAFYDLQDRLGYDQPSKAVEWLIKAADEAIAELPSLNSPFPETPPKQLSDGKQRECAELGGFDSADVELDCEYPNYEQQHQQQHQHQRQLSLSKSACSSTSETSKGSGLSLSRSDVRENRVKARERARERAAKEKENESSIAAHLPNNNTSSFTELLNAGISSSVSNNNNNHNTSNTSASAQQSPGGGGGGGDDGPGLFHKARQWPTSTPMDYFTTGLLGSSRAGHHINSGYSGQIQLGNNSHLPQSMIIPPFAVVGDSHHHPPELQHFSFLPDHHLIPVAANHHQPGGGGGGGNENYNLNFTISSSSGLAGFNRGTLQSNSSVPSMFPHLQRFSPIDGSSNVPFFIGGAAAAPSPAAAASPLENNNNNHHHHYHQFAPGFDGRLQLYHGDGTRHSDQKGKGKN